jgi:uracil phosphoribosyltransferase
MNSTMSDHIKIPTIDVKKYGGKQVALADGKVIASGQTLADVMREVKKQEPQRSLRDVVFLAVPKSLYVIYHV